MSFARYPNYKDSGVEWLGEVPGHWGVSALKRGFDVALGKMLQPEATNPDDELLPYLRAANVKWKGIDSTEIKQMWISKRDRTQLKLKYGDLLISEGGDVGRSCLWEAELEECYFQNSVNRVRARNGYSNRYLYYWMSTIKDKGYIDVLCNKSTIAHFTAEKVSAVPTPLPPAQEQTQIAAFLGRETAKIDGLVAEQRRLMVLLKEKRQAVISHAVTRGLNPDATMKPSGIEWLGDVPAHWDVSAIKRYAVKITDGAHVSPETENGVFDFISTKDVGTDSIDFENCLRTSKLSYESMVKTGCRPLVGDVLFSKDGTIGRTVVILEDRDFVVASSLIIIRPTANILDSKFLNCLCQSQGIANQVECFVKGAGLPRLSIQNLTKVVGCFPPLSEQKAIAAFLATESSKFDTLTTEAQRAIDLLQERRTALISAVVTGQIDVRDVRADIPPARDSKRQSAVRSART